MSQLPLNLNLQTHFSFENFYLLAENYELVELLADIQTPRFEQLLLWGESSSGKSHLLQAYCNKAQLFQRSVFYVPLKTFAAYGSGVLVGMERFDTLVIDDFELVLGDVTWEETLYGLITERHHRHQRLILGTASAPKMLICELNDLKERLKWGLIYEIKSPNVTQMMDVLKWGALQRGFELNDSVIDYIARHYPQNMGCLSNILDYIDRFSLRARRKITRPFVQQILRNFRC